MKRQPVAALAVSASIALLLLAGCTTPPAGDDNSVDLADIQVRKYEGEDLSSITHFRENSIRGPQYVDIDNYVLNVNGLVDDPKAYEYDGIITTCDTYRNVVTLYCVEGWDVTIL